MNTVVARDCSLPTILSSTSKAAELRWCRPHEREKCFVTLHIMLPLVGRKQITVACLVLLSTSTPMSLIKLFSISIQEPDAGVDH